VPIPVSARNPPASEQVPALIRNRELRIAAIQAIVNRCTVVTNTASRQAPWATLGG
jgi:hypothetical protein